MVVIDTPISLYEVKCITHPLAQIVADKVSAVEADRVYDESISVPFPSGVSHVTWDDIFRVILIHPDNSQLSMVLEYLVDSARGHNELDGIRSRKVKLCGRAHRSAILTREFSIQHISRDAVCILSSGFVTQSPMRNCLYEQVLFTPSGQRRFWDFVIGVIRCPEVCLAVKRWQTRWPIGIQSPERS